MGSAVTLADALQWLALVLGPGGLAAVLIAWRGYKRGQQQDNPKLDGMMGVGAILADRHAADRLAQAAERLAAAHDKEAEATRGLASAVYRLIDRISDTARVVSDEIRELRSAVERNTPPSRRR